MILFCMLYCIKLIVIDATANASTVEIYPSFITIRISFCLSDVFIQRHTTRQSTAFIMQINLQINSVSSVSSIERFLVPSTINSFRPVPGSISRNLEMCCELARLSTALHPTLPNHLHGRSSRLGRSKREFPPAAFVIPLHVSCVAQFKDPESTPPTTTTKQQLEEWQQCQLLKRQMAIMRPSSHRCPLPLPPAVSSANFHSNSNHIPFDYLPSFAYQVIVSPPSPPTESD